MSMMENLPKGLVAKSARIPSRLEAPSHVDAGDIARLWKVYHASASIHKNDAGHRLENFFWRIWGNKQLLKSLQGSTLTKLFSSIAGASPVSSSESGWQSLKKMPSEPAISKAHGTIKKMPDTSPMINEGSSHALPGTHAPAPAKFPTHPPTSPPILKKSSATNGNSNSTDSSQKTARLFLTGLGGQHIRKPSSPLTPISPPPFAALPTDSAGSNAARQSHYQKRPHFVAGKAGRRRPVLSRRKSSQTSVPSLLRSEVRVEPDVPRDCEGQGVAQEDKPAELCNNGIMKGEKPDPRDIRARVSEVCANQQQQGLNFFVVPKTSKSNSKARPRYGGQPKTIPYAQASPTKLVDDHFRLRFAKEMQREETMLKAVNSLPESERKAALERYIRALTGQEPPKQPKTAWLVVPDDEAACHEPEPMSNNNIHEEWPSATGDETSKAWMPDDAQDYYPNTPVDAIPFKLEGMSYASSSRAASRLQAPGQLTVLLRAEQYGYCSDAGIVDST